VLVRIAFGDAVKGTRMKCHYGLLSMLLLFCALPARGFTPETGFYNMFTSDAEGRGGTGMAIEVQNDYLFAAGFVYRPDGTPTFVTIEGNLVHESNGRLSLSNDHGVAIFTGGQCIGALPHCPYRAPISTNIAGFSLEFSAENEGTLVWGTKDDSASVTLRRTCVGSICYDAPSSLLGEWDVILDRVRNPNGLSFGGDKLAITDVSPHGDMRAISGCVAQRDSVPPDCTNPTGKEELIGTAARCADTTCAGYSYRIEVHATDCRGPCRILRVYTFAENGNGGAFGGTIRGIANLCGAGARAARACVSHPGVPFVAYRSGSVNFVRTGVGTD
jgi:hypothetical protein